MTSRVIFLLAAAIPTLAVADAALQESNCLVILTDDGGKTQRVEVPTLQVLEQTAASAEFFLPTDAPAKPKAIMCVRSSPVPAPNDYKVVVAGYPFYVAAIDAQDSRRMIVLEISEGQFRARILQGELSQEEARSLASRLNEFQDAIQSPKQ